MRYSEPFLRVECEKILEASRRLPVLGELLRGGGTGKIGEGAKDKPHPLLTDPGWDWPAQRLPHPHPLGPVTQAGPPAPASHTLPALLSLSKALLPSLFLFSFHLPCYYHFFLFLSYMIRLSRSLTSYLT